jgi:glycosyltransferase involved in cell wall biosynthesis
MRVLMLTPSFPPYCPSGGGANDRLRDAELLARSNHHVTVISGLSKVGPKVEESSFRTLRVKFPDAPPRALWYQLANRNLILRLVSQFDVVYAYSPAASLLIRDITDTGVPVVAKMAGSPVSDLQRYTKVPFKNINIKEMAFMVAEFPLFYQLAKMDLLRSTHLIFDSKHAMRSLERQFGQSVAHKSTVIHNKVDDGLLQEVEEMPSASSADIIFVGRLIASKGILDLIEAFSMLLKRQNVANRRLIIVGDGPLRPRLQSMVRRMQLEDRIILTGRVLAERVFEEERRSRLFVLPSYSESNSVALAEAMSIGLPIIVPYLEWAIEETATYSNKMFFVPGDVRDLAEKIEKISGLPFQRTPQSQVDESGASIDLVLQRVVDAHDCLRHL